MLKIVLILNLVVVLLAAGAVIYSHTMVRPAPTDQAAEADSLKREALNQSQIQPVPIKKFVVNLHSGPNRLRYLDVEMNILPFHEDQKQIIKNNEHVFKDALVEIASKLGPEDLDTVTGKILLENKIKKQVNTKFQELGTRQPVVKHIYFSGFVVQ